MYDAAARKSFRESVELHVDAAKAMREKGARYPELRQCFSFVRAAEMLSRSKRELTDEDKRQVQDWLDLALSRVGVAAGDAEVPDRLLSELGGLMASAAMKAAQDPKTGLDKVFGAVTKSRPGGAFPLVFKGELYIKYAWDARGSGQTNTVTADGWKKMGERLVEAEQALTAAWKMNPDGPDAPTLMIGVELGQGKGRQVMETWYKRAMDANPDNRDACHRKMYYLEPKWHGSAEDMLNFGRELLAGGNWGARLPFYLVDAHLILAGYTKDRENYYKNEAVWKDLHAVYEPYLSLQPDSAWDRTYYAKLACWCGRWTEAKAQFDKLGDKAEVWAFADRAEMERLRAQAADNSK
jgi:hypothetical protein